MIPIVGNICEPNLGMDLDSARAIMEDVNVIIESAAITTLNERLVFFPFLNLKSIIWLIASKIFLDSIIFFNLYVLKVKILSYTHPIST